MNKIGVIEDDLDLLRLLKYNLEKKGFQMVGATAGKGGRCAMRQGTSGSDYLGYNAAGL